MAELAQYTRRELDFRREARTAERLRQLLAGDDRIVIPAVISDRSSERVLTTEFLAGLPPEPAADLRRAGIDPEAVLRAGAAANAAPGLPVRAVPRRPPPGQRAVPAR